MTYREPKTSAQLPGLSGRWCIGDKAPAAGSLVRRDVETTYVNKQASALALRGTWAFLTVAFLVTLASSGALFAQADPAAEPAVLAVAKVLPAVVNINTERVVRRTVRDPFDDFYSQFFGYYQRRP